MFDAVINTLLSVLARFGKIFAAVFQTMWDITVDLIIVTLDLSLSITGALISPVLVPQFLTQYPLQLLIGQTGSNISYFASVFNIPQGLAILGAGVVFRLFACKLFTLDQW